MAPRSLHVVISTAIVAIYKVKLSQRHLLAAIENNWMEAPISVTILYVLFLDIFICAKNKTSNIASFKIFEYWSWLKTSYIATS